MDAQSSHTTKAAERPVFLLDPAPLLESHPALTESSKERLKKLPHIAPFFPTNTTHAQPRNG
eukprot:26745_6